LGQGGRDRRPADRHLAVDPAVRAESVRWLLSRGRNADARREAAKLLGVGEDSISLPNAIETTRKAGSFMELWRDQKRFWWVVVIWIGISTGTYDVTLWGPAILSQLLKISAHEAAHYFVYVSISSLLGRVLGPVCLALIAGSNDVVSPKATTDAIARPSCSLRPANWRR
jgi:cyanate permease